ncbi:hypothetical protein SMKI_03G0710 [Saccharomyces mikatae IFO 1815]|uniref:Haloacid dehalogenase-like hydrolase n=1 Tax=Saccharomyces mikatae IFO 1815 TaxID=226126 RepID=A0AA35IXB8_SACMI|nr:uncharacterized protein SMKI_03G0710 [Saccharomyces mikatae IFO 1815]CAI4037596.1 hypothetical protein SMKI_03G0710 [Saccharomyces mikatae IFO 1815]
MRNIIISDFDETITRDDTIDVIAKLPYLLHPDLKPEWRYFIKTYMEGCREYKYNGTRSLPLLSPSLPKIISQCNFGEIFKDEIKYQNHNRIIELNSVNEITKQEIFKSITLEQMKKFARDQNHGNCLLRNGFNRFCSSVIKNFEDDFYILSINWSREFIYEIIGNSRLNRDHIFCNGLKKFTGKFPPTYNGEFDCGLLTGSDKVKKLDEILAKSDTDSNKEDETHCYWYIGDSETDLLPILHPSTNGILLLDPQENPSKFLKIAEKTIGISSDMISDFQIDESLAWLEFCEKEGGKSAYLVKSWDSIGDLIMQKTVGTSMKF